MNENYYNDHSTAPKENYSSVPQAVVAKDRTDLECQIDRYRSSISFLKQLYKELRSVNDKLTPRVEAPKKQDNNEVAFDEGLIGQLRYNNSEFESTLNDFGNEIDLIKKII